MSEDRDSTVRIEPLLVGIENLASMLGLSVSTVKDMDRYGRLPMPVQIQTIRRRLWDVDEIRRWKQAGFPIREKWQKMKELS